MNKMANIEFHVHPYFGRNNLKDVITAMNQRNIDILGLESLNESIFPYIVKEAKKLFNKIYVDQYGIRLPNKKYILNAREYTTKEHFHILTIGYSKDEVSTKTEIRKIIDDSLNKNALVILDHPFIDNIKTRTAGHISEKMESYLEDLCKDYTGLITIEWNSYCIPWMRKVLKSGLNSFGFKIQYYDVNQKVELLSKKLSLLGYNVPVIADTDLHARTKRQLLLMGTSLITSNVTGDNTSEIFISLKKNIFTGNYNNIKRYVSSFHLITNFCLPVLMPWKYERPRA